MLLLKLIDGSKVIFRPSGTEPKIKLYAEVVIKPVTKMASNQELHHNKQLAK